MTYLAEVEVQDLKVQAFKVQCSSSQSLPRFNAISYTLSGTIPKHGVAYVYPSLILTVVNVVDGKLNNLITASTSAYPHRLAFQSFFNKDQVRCLRLVRSPKLIGEVDWIKSAY